MENLINTINLINKDSFLNYYYVNNVDFRGLHKTMIDIFYKQKSRTVPFQTQKNELYGSNKDENEHEMKETFNEPKFNRHQYIKNSSGLTADVMRWILLESEDYEGSWIYKTPFTNEDISNGVYQIHFSKPMESAHVSTIFFDRYVYQSDMFHDQPPSWKILDHPLDLSQSTKLIYETLTEKNYEDYEFKQISFMIPKKDAVLNFDLDINFLNKKLNIGEFTLKKMQESFKANQQMIESIV